MLLKITLSSRPSLEHDKASTFYACSPKCRGIGMRYQFCAIASAAAFNSSLKISLCSVMYMSAAAVKLLSI